MALMVDSLTEAILAVVLDAFDAKARHLREREREHYRELESQTDEEEDQKGFGFGPHHVMPCHAMQGQ
ncbi:hypothetical protein L484_008549 [Morus notabilis]|uniref:Uncharacterized protein n=1 Tax=Morus notabilis TaxID=981085 RepID=W9S761_9ROSA|nr:hypothetical protein L484_008549 [Morus notabilis]